MADLNPRAPIGWKKWQLERNLITNSTSTATTSLIVPDIPFPILYTPASAFWIKLYLDHCLITFLFPYSFLTTALSTGGTTSLFGLLSGVQIASLLATLPPNLDLGLGRFPNAGTVGGPGPIAG
jgi:hypothetical protein